MTAASTPPTATPSTARSAPSPTPQNPVVTLGYSSTTSEFTLTAKNASTLTYTITYTWQKPDATGKTSAATDALTATKNAVGTQPIIDKKIAGTVSSGDISRHAVTGGTLTASGKTLDGRAYTFEQTFTLTATQQLKTLSEKMSSSPVAGAVLGAFVPPAEDASDAAVPTTAKPTAAAARPAVTATPQPLTLTPTSSDSSLTTTQMVIGISGGIIIILGILGLILWYIKQKNTPTQPGV